ncbi:MAG: hypothetical protein R3Y16_06535 [Rikenellaceae bacterium]
MDMFRDYKEDGAHWITLANGEYYPDVLVDACKLYTPILELFGQLIKHSESSDRLFLSTVAVKESWMRIQLARVFCKYVSPNTPVEMLKQKRKAEWVCSEFGRSFRAINEVQKVFHHDLCPMRRCVQYCESIKIEGRRGTI